jgi:hypothetical protein
LPLIQGTITVALNGTEMDEDIVFGLTAGDKTEPLGIVKPLYCAAYTLTHT